MLAKILLLFTLLTAFQCKKSSPQPFSQLQPYIHYFRLDLRILNQSLLSQNITFNSTREKYYFIYFPLFETCLEKIGEDFQPLLDSVTPSGIGAAGYGIFAGMKLALKMGLWKTGLFGLLKASTATLFSVSALPVAIGVGTIAYMYNKHQKDEIKQKCNQLVNIFENVVNYLELDFLIHIKATVYEDLMGLNQKLSEINEQQKSIRSVLKKCRQQVSYLKPKIQMYRKYFTTLKQIMNL